MKPKQKAKLTVKTMIITTLATKHYNYSMDYENKTERKANRQRDITTMLATKHDSVAYENKTEGKANSHKDDNCYSSHVAWLMKTKIVGKRSQ